MTLRAGQAFILDPEDKTTFPTHCYVIISDPQQNNDVVALVNFTSYDPGANSQPRNDPACLLKRGDHPYIRHATCINYRDALFLSEDQVSRLDDGQLIEWQPDVDGALLATIRAAAITSDHRTGRLVKLLREQGLA